MIQNKNEFGKLPEIELVKFEKANNVKLPADYRDFLPDYNGGKPIRTRMRVRKQ